MKINLKKKLIWAALPLLFSLSGYAQSLMPVGHHGELLIDDRHEPSTFFENRSERIQSSNMDFREPKRFSHGFQPEGLDYAQIKTNESCRCDSLHLRRDNGSRFLYFLFNCEPTFTVAYDLQYSDEEIEYWVHNTYDEDGNRISFIRDTKFLGSSQFVRHEEMEWQHDSEGRVTMVSYRDLEQVNWYNADYKHEFEYNLQGFETEIVYWVFENGNWVKDRQVIYVRDVSGEVLVEQLTREWSGFGWVNSWRTQYTYNTLGYKSIVVSSNWENGSWVNFGRTEYEYDSNGNETVYRTQNWDDFQWINSYQTLRTYDSSGNQLETVDQEWDENNWANLNRSLRTFNNSGDFLTVEFQEWGNGNWQGVQRSFYEYDGNGRRTSYYYQELGSGDWMNIDRNLTEYSGDSTVTIYQFGDENGAGWKNDRRTTWINNSIGNAGDYLSEEWEYIGFTGAWVLTSTMSFDYENDVLSNVESEGWVENEWVDGNVEIYSSCGPTGLEEHKEYSGISTYPNPASNVLTVNGSFTPMEEVSVSITSMLGELVFQRSWECNSAGGLEKTIDLTNVSPGIYLLTVNRQDKVESKKFVVSR